MPPYNIRLQRLALEVMPTVQWAQRIKFHKMAQHLGLIIRLFGRLTLGTTQFVERDHQTNSKQPYALSNHKDFIRQFTRSVRNSLHLTNLQLSQRYIDLLLRPPELPESLSVWLRSEEQIFVGTPAYMSLRSALVDQSHLLGGNDRRAVVQQLLLYLSSNDQRSDS